jgi:glycosyltransferase involved in cell wall biosynthesis
MVVSESEWARADTIEQYGLDAAKVVAIARGAPTALYQAEPDLPAIRRRFDLPDPFALYPARTWPHKNHLRLVEALALARERDGLELLLVFTGQATKQDEVVRARAAELGVGERIRFLGFVEPVELIGLYRLARFVIVPSLFEGGGFPLLEAFREGAPVASSSATALPEIGGDAVLLFDPFSLEDITAALRRLTADDAVRRQLRGRGEARSKLFDWCVTADAYVELYRSLAPKRHAAAPVS